MGAGGDEGHDQSLSIECPPSAARTSVQTRENWQVVGESLIKEDVQQFCASVVAQAHWTPGGTLVIDGIRHMAVLQALKEMVSPSSLRLVYIDADDGTREQRLKAAGTSKTPLRALDLHSTELEVKKTLRDVADLIVDGTQPADRISKEVVKWTSKLP